MGGVFWASLGALRADSWQVPTIFLQQFESGFATFPATSQMDSGDPMTASVSSEVGPAALVRNVGCTRKHERLEISGKAVGSECQDKGLESFNTASLLSLENSAAHQLARWPKFYLQRRSFEHSLFRSLPRETASITCNHPRKAVHVHVQPLLHAHQPESLDLANLQSSIIKLASI